MLNQRRRSLGTVREQATARFEDFKIQSTLVISNSKGLSEILRDIRIPRHIRFADLRKKSNKQPHLTNLFVI